MELHLKMSSGTALPIPMMCFATPVDWLWTRCGCGRTVIGPETRSGDRCAAEDASKAVVYRSAIGAIPGQTWHCLVEKRSLTVQQKGYVGSHRRPKHTLAALRWGSERGPVCGHKRLEWHVAPWEVEHLSTRQRQVQGAIQGLALRCRKCLAPRTLQTFSHTGSER